MGVGIVMLRVLMEILSDSSAKKTIDSKTVVSLDLTLPYGILFYRRRGSFGDPCLVIAIVHSDEYTSA